MIDPLATFNPPVSGAGTAGAVPLEQALNLGAKPSSVEDADLDALYEALLGADEDADMAEFLKAFTNAAGERPFRNIGPQMEGLQEVMARLKKDGQQGSPLYAGLSSAFSKAFSMNFMLQQYMMTAMSGSDDEDSAENVEW